MEDNIQLITDVLNKMVYFIEDESCLHKGNGYQAIEIAEGVIQDIYTTEFHSTQINNNTVNNYLDSVFLTNDIQPFCVENAQMVTVTSLNEKKCKKNVSFNEYGKMYFIPNRSELFEDSEKNEIWWNGMDFLNFRNQATCELREFMRQNPTADYKKYSKTLWLVLDFDAIYEYYHTL